MGGEPQSLPRAEGMGGGGQTECEGGRERKELRIVLAGLRRGSSLVFPIYLALSR